ncbi:MAG: HEPN domain-containing protein [Anaerolineae bacterium]|jgi:HEPN domain-containing protein
MKPTTLEWLARATEDLAAAQVLLSRPDLTNVVAFHAQQAAEKALKAVIEELDLGFVRTHSLTRLYELVRLHYPVVGNMDMLDRLDSVYIEARYPGEMGLLPFGKPTSDEAADLFGFANDIFHRLQAGLQDEVAPVAAGSDES